MKYLEEPMHPDDFIQTIVQDIEEYFEQNGINKWFVDRDKNQDDEKLNRIILSRIRMGFFNEIWIRDVANKLMKYAPSLKVQQALLRQVNDEHKHTFWLLDACKKRGFDPREQGPETNVWAILWEYLLGHIDSKENFLSGLSTAQLVLERIGGLKATQPFAEAIADVDPELSELYGKKIYRDELFHTIELPESILRDHCTNLASQNQVIEGYDRAKQLMKVIFPDFRSRIEASSA